MDLAIGSGDNYIKVLKNKSVSGTIDASSFAASVQFTGTSGERHIVIADLDLDGKPEITTDNSAGGGMSVFRNVIPTTGGQSLSAPSRRLALLQFSANRDARVTSPAEAQVLSGGDSFAAPVLRVVRIGNAFKVRLQVATGQRCALEYKDSLEDSDWTLLTVVQGIGGEVDLEDRSADGMPSRFYRVSIIK